MQLTGTVAAPDTRGQRSWALVLTSVAFFMTALDALVVVTALPAIHASLGGSVGTLEWTVNAYTLPFAAGIITAAAIGDKFGRRRMYVAGLLLFTVASAACAIAPTASALITARAFQGLGAALVTPLSLTILAAVFPPERRGTIVGIWGAIGGLAVAGGPLVGGAVVQGLDWHWIFWINVPIGLAAAILSTVRLPESRGQARRLDIGGLVLVAVGAVALAWGLVRTTDVGWRNAQVITALCVGAVLIAAFIAWERRVAEPMLPLRLLRIRAFTAANATGFTSMAAITSAAFLMSQFFQLGLGYTPFGTGLRFLPWTATPLIVAPIAGRLADRIGARPLMATGMAMQAGGLLWVALDITTGASYGELVLPLVIAGIGISMAIPTTPTAALGAVPPGDIGTASGVLNTMQRFGAVFGVAIVAAVFSASGHLGSAAGIVDGVRPALATSAGLSLLGGLSALAVSGRRRSVAAEGAVQPTAGAGQAPALASANEVSNR
ncbi:MAG TPA: DHA2 family efflux MFS transporter permease subunit [Streptosporangiaceae bacterium]|nr:DHA2 family efflux MFS transporter permease subunit [Streptosporangiaceae bacterium]